MIGGRNTRVSKILAIDDIKNLRNSLTADHTAIVEMIKTSSSPVVQELILAQRHIEDARMRLGVALGYEQGNDPWSGNLKKED